MNRPIHFLLLALLTSPALGADWSACASALDDLQEAAEQAQQQASNIDSYESRMKREKRTLDSCLQFPDTFDLLDDGCAMYRQNYETAKRRYENEVRDLENEVSNVENAFGGVRTSCGSK